MTEDELLMHAQDEALAEMGAATDRLRIRARRAVPTIVRSRPVTALSVATVLGFAAAVGARSPRVRETVVVGARGSVRRLPSAMRKLRVLVPFWRLLI